MTIRTLRTPIVVALLAALAGSAVSSSRRSIEPAQSSPPQAAAVAPQDVDALAQGIAFHRWTQYLTNIGWPAERLPQAMPRFLASAARRAPHPNGEWTVVFDGSEPGMLLTITVRTNARGDEIGDTLVEWADILVAE